MLEYITVKCPSLTCDHEAVFDAGGLPEADARRVIAMDDRCCRRCGTLLIEEEEEEAQDDDS